MHPSAPATRKERWKTLPAVGMALGLALTALMPTTVLAQTSFVTEIQVTKALIPDYEFDWGKKGVNCPTCNFGDGNSRLVFSDPSYKLWVGHVDFQTGAFIEPDGHGVLIDTDAAKPTDFGNGPEWMSSTGGSQFVYTKYLPGTAPLPGKDPDPTTAGIALASMVNGVWTAGFFPNGMGRASPAGTLDTTDSSPRINYVDSDKGNVYWRTVSPPGVEHDMPAVTELTTGNSRRWVDGTRKIIFQGHPLDSPQLLIDQVFLYDTDSGEREQLTFDANGKDGAFMWQAPEFNNEYVFFTMSSFRQQMLVYRKLPGTDGVARWTVIKTINAPKVDGATWFFWSPEPFVHNGRSYIFTEVGPSSKFFDRSIPTQVAISGVDPLRVDFRVLTDPATAPYRVRLDPEVFITAQGPFIYYNRIVPASADYPDGINDGVWRVDTGLGPPKATASAQAVGSRTSR